MSDYLSKLFSLKGKTAIVTGGSGQLGCEYVKALLGAGAKVAVFDISFEKTRGKIHAIKSKDLLLVPVDITQKESVELGLKTVLKKFKRADILINNAAIDAPPNAPEEETGPFETYPESSWQKIMDVNLKGIIFCCQVVGGYMAKNRGGSIINISSIYGMVSPDQRIYEYKAKPFTKPVTYSVSKGGIFNLTRYLATYWGKKKVRVNTLTLAGVYNKQDEQFLKNYTVKIPLGKMADSTDYNGAIIFLASDAACYMTGSNMVVDGGYTSW